MTDQIVTINIDGQDVNCPASATIYEAATAAGFHIPTFCHHEKLVPVGACRMCLVEIEGVRGLQTSCSTPVRDGMVVKVHTSPAAVKARKANIEFLLTNHPLDCPVCDKGGECPLQDQALQDGPGQSRYIEEKRHKNKRYPLGELIVLDQERCVLCWRCIRFLDEWADDHELDLFGRGANTRIDVFAGRPMTSKWQGNTIELCPVGALTSRAFRFEARVWELTDAPSICTLCGVGCNITVGAKNNELRRVTPRENSAVNDCWICDKGRFGHAFVNHRERLTSPLIQKDGAWHTSTWDKALDYIAQRLSQIMEDQGPQAIGALGSASISNEANYLLQRFIRTVIGCNNIDHLGRRPRGTSALRDLPALEHKDVILLLGFDPSTEAPLVELWLKKAMLRHGAQMIVASPNPIEMGPYAEPEIRYRPGTEVALLNGLAQAILEEGLVHGSTRVTNLEEFRDQLKSTRFHDVARLAGTGVQSLQQAAQKLTQASNPVILYGPTLVHGTQVETLLAALNNLMLLLGGKTSLGFVARDSNTLGASIMGVVPDLYPGERALSGTRVRSRLSSVWSSKLSPVEGLDLAAMVQAARQKKLRALWVVDSDPIRYHPGARKALEVLDFLVVQDQFLTETASKADVVLPAASQVETDGTHINLAYRLQRTRASLRPPGQAKSNVSIIVELAQRMVDGKQRKTWSFSSPANVWTEITKAVPAYRGIDYETIVQEGWQHPPPKETPTRTLHGTTASVPAPDTEYPLILATGKVLYDNSKLMQHSPPIPNLVPAAYVEIHPQEAQKAGLSQGDLVRVVSRAGQIAAALHISERVAPGVASVPSDLAESPLATLYLGGEAQPRVRIEKLDTSSEHRGDVE